MDYFDRLGTIIVLTLLCGAVLIDNAYKNGVHTDYRAITGVVIGTVFIGLLTLGHYHKNHH